MLGNQYTSFFRDYSGSLLDRLSKSSENLWKYALLKADKDGNIKLSEEDKTFIDEYADGIKAIDKRIAEAPDSLKPQIVKEFNEGPLVKGLNEIIARKGVNEAIEAILNLRDYNLMINAADSLGWSQIQKDIMLSTKIYYFIDNIRQPLKPFLLKFADDNIHQGAAIEAIHELNDKYLTLANKQISTDNLKSSDDVKGLSEGEQILNKILEPYKGKIVLLDIWGTWCGPCKQALSHSQEEYEHLKDYPMVYLYLANRSNDESWKNVIKEYNVTGENVVHYNLPTPQQRAVENFLNVRSFPTYKLFNKEGKLLDVNADPRNINALEGLIKQINE